MLLFWLLAAYLLTRSPRSGISLTAVAAQAATACYLLGVGMAANTQGIEHGVPWQRNLQWGATVAPALWYWLTVLLLAEAERQSARDGVERTRYRRTVAVPLGILLAAASAVLTGAIYVQDALIAWSQTVPVPPSPASYERFTVPSGPIYPGFVAFLAASTVGAVVNIFRCWEGTVDPVRRRRFVWLLASGLLFLLGANLLGLANWLFVGLVPPWVGHLVLAAAMAVMGWNVAAYSLLFKGQVIRRDFWYFLTSLVLVVLAYTLVFMVVGGAYTFTHLALFMMTLTLIILSHAMIDLGRQVLDRLFFSGEVQQLRANLAAVAQDAALTPNLDTVLDEAQAEIAEVSSEHLVRLTEHALRRLNRPSALAECALADRLPFSLQGGLHGATANANEPHLSESLWGQQTPLERARALREILTAAIERLKPPDTDAGIGSPAALEYHILREEYLQGLLNKQIMARHSISEGTFNRNRRQAIAALARELKTREERLAGSALHGAAMGADEAGAVARPTSMPSA